MFALEINCTSKSSVSLTVIGARATPQDDAAVRTKLQRAGTIAVKLRLISDLRAISRAELTSVNMKATRISSTVPEDQLNGSGVSHHVRSVMPSHVPS